MSASSPELPTVSIVVPTYRRPAPLAACLAALATLDYPRDRFEVIVVDDGSGSPPRALVAAYAEQLRISLVERENGGPGAARNTGVERAVGEYLAFTDDDCLPDANWLLALAARWASEPQAALGGCTLNALTANPFSAASQLLVSYLYEYYARDPADARRFYTTNNLALPAAGFRAIGGFDTTTLADTAEDRDLCDRWRRAGHALLYEPRAIVRHAHDLGPRTFCRQHFAYGRGSVYFHQARGRESVGQIGPDLRFYAGLLPYPFRAGSAWRAPAHATLLGLSQAAYAAGFFLERTRVRRSLRVSGRS